MHISNQGKGTKCCRL